MSDESWDMAAVLSHYGRDVQLYVGWRSLLCPFHEERRPSARASLEGFLCNSCGIRGDAIKIIMEVESVDFSRAITLYEEWTGDRHHRVPETAKRKSWGIRPFGARDNQRNSRKIQTGVHKRPFDGR